MARVDLDLSGIGLRLSDLPDEMANRLEEEWGPFVVPDCGEPFLDLRIAMTGGQGEPGPFRPREMQAETRGDTARFRMPEGRAEVGGDGSGSLVLEKLPGLTPYYAMHNLLRGCLAWRMPQRDGALLHAAGLVVRGRAFALVGASGAGKTTWARLGRDAGEVVIGDDLLLLDGAGSGIEALGSPFRSFHVADYRPGRWPLGAVLFPVHGPGPAAWSECPSARARSRIVANLPFVSAALEHDARVVRTAERIVREVPCRDLTFARDAGFVELLRAF
jgi:hypothetical protein